MMVQVVRNVGDERRVRRRTSLDEDDSDNSEVQLMVYSFNFFACSPSPYSELLNHLILLACFAVAVRRGNTSGPKGEGGVGTTSQRARCCRN